MSVKIEWTLTDYLAGNKIETRDCPVIRLDELTRWLEGHRASLEVKPTNMRLIWNNLTIDRLLDELKAALRA